MGNMPQLSEGQREQNGRLLKNWFLNMPSNRQLIVNLKGGITEYHGRDDEESSTHSDIDKTFDIRVANIYLKDDAFYFILTDQAYVGGVIQIVPFMLSVDEVIRVGDYAVHAGCRIDSLALPCEAPLMTSFGSDEQYYRVQEFPIALMEYNARFCDALVYPHISNWSPGPKEALLAEVNKYEPLFK